MDNKTTGSILLVAGTAIGAGMLALPVTTGMAGFWPAVGLFIAGFAYMMLNLALLFEALLYESDQSTNIISIAGKHLGIAGQVAAWLSFMLLMYAASAAYLTEGGKIVANLVHSFWAIHPVTITVFFAVAAAGLTLAGVKALEITNRGFMVGLFLSYLALIFLVAPHIELHHLHGSELGRLPASLPIVVLAFTSHIILPSLREYLDDDIEKIKKTLIIGNLCPLVFYIIWLFLILGLVPLRGETNSLQAIAQTADPLATLFGTFQQSASMHYIGISQNWFALCALITSFLAVCISLKDFIADGIHIKEKVANPKIGELMTTGLALVPPLCFALFYPDGFERALNYAGVFVAVLFGILPGLIAYRARKMAMAEQLTPKFCCPGGTPLIVLQVSIALFIIYYQIAF